MWITALLTCCLLMPVTQDDPDVAVSPHVPSVEELVQLYAGDARPPLASLQELVRDLEGLQAHWASAAAEHNQALLRHALDRAQGPQEAPADQAAADTRPVIGRLEFVGPQGPGVLVIHEGDDPEVDRLTTELRAVGDAARQALLRTFGRLPPADRGGLDPGPGTGTGPGQTDDCTCSVSTVHEDLPGEGCASIFGVLMSMLPGHCPGLCGPVLPCQGTVTAFVTTNDPDCQDLHHHAVVSGGTRIEGDTELETFTDEDGNFISKTKSTAYTTTLVCGGLLEITFRQHMSNNMVYRITVYCGNCPD